MNYWLGGFHYGVLITPKYGRDQELRLFNSLEKAMKDAKFYLHNAESVCVLDVQFNGFTGKTLFHSFVSRKLVKSKESQ